jgi:hypothetical protein
LFEALVWPGRIVMSRVFSQHDRNRGKLITILTGKKKEHRGFDQCWNPHWVEKENSASLRGM